MKTFRICIWILPALVTLVSQAAAPNITPLGALSAQLQGPARVAADAVGNLYVTEPSAGRVVVFNAFGQLTAVHDGFAGPLAIAIATNETIYLSEKKSGCVSVFNPQWERLYQLGCGTNEFQLPGNLAVDPRAPEVVYVADGPANVVRVYSGPTLLGQFGGTGAGNGQFHFPAGVGISSRGEVFVLDQNNDRVQVFTNGSFSRLFNLATGESAPAGRYQAVFVDTADHVFVADTMQGRVKVFDAQTGLLLKTIGNYGLATGQLNLPLGLVLDSLNRLCIASANNSRVELFGVDDFLHLSAQAANGRLAAGSDLVISVVVGGTNAAGFQWLKNGVTVGGATNATLTVASTTPGDSGNYSVVVQSAAGSITSSVAPVAVLAPPHILSAPGDQKILAGAPAVFAVVATGDDLNFQWQFNGQNLPDATNGILTLPGAQAAQSGQYAVTVINAVGSATTAPANLTVVTPPLVMDMVSAAALADGTFQLTLNVDAGFNYDLEATTDLLQWQPVTSISAGGLVDFVDTDATNFPNRFYRLHWLQP